MALPCYFSLSLRLFDMSGVRAAVENAKSVHLALKAVLGSSMASSILRLSRSPHVSNNPKQAQRFIPGNPATYHSTKSLRSVNVLRKKFIEAGLPADTFPVPEKKNTPMKWLLRPPKGHRGDKATAAREVNVKKNMDRMPAILEEWKKVRVSSFGVC